MLNKGDTFIFIFDDFYYGKNSLSEPNSTTKVEIQFLFQKCFGFLKKILFAQFSKPLRYFL